MHSAPAGGGMAAVAVEAEGSATAVAPPGLAGGGDSFSRLPPPRAQDSQLTEDDEDEVVEQDPTGEACLGTFGVAQVAVLWWV